MFVNVFFCFFFLKKNVLFLFFLEIIWVLRRVFVFVFFFFFEKCVNGEGHV
jgi:hypothetical protein